MRSDSDEELVARVRRGDREAAGLLVERYLRSCRAVALSVIGRLPEAEDACQDAFVYAIERIEDCRHPERFGAWLLRIVRNRALNSMRDRTAHAWEPIDHVPSIESSTSPERFAERSVLRDQLLDALGNLSQVRREVVLLHDLEGWTHREIADRMDLPAGTVRSHLHHARRRLRDLLGESIDD